MSTFNDAGERIRQLRRDHGFTLIELMVTLAIAAILMMVAVPGMTAFQRNAELTSATNALLAAINAARGEALKRGVNAVVAPFPGTTWNSGIVAYVDSNRNGSYDDGTDIVILKQPALAGYFSVTAGPSPQPAAASSPYIMFNPSGYAVNSAGTVGIAGASSLQITRTDLTAAKKWDQTRRLMVAATGRVRTCKPASDTGDSTCMMNTPG